MGKNAVKKTSIGGQAVIEGVMMRGRTAEAVCVRDAGGVIRTESRRIRPPEKRFFLLRLPVIRGVVAFCSSLFGGMNTLTRSAEVFGEEEKPNKFEIWLAKVFHFDVMRFLTAVSIVLGVGLAVLLFVLLPSVLSELLEKTFQTQFSPFAKNFIEGGIKILIFILYILFCTLIPDVRRTFAYHGAEHKTISCFENGLALTPENAKKCSRIHDRCGTTFIFFVMLIGILIFALFESLLAVYDIKLSVFYRVLIKIGLLPLVAGLSYELLKGLSKTKSKWFLPLKLPGMALQCLTTREPDEKMLEVAIAAFNEVMKMDADASYPTKRFVLPEPAKDVTKRVVACLKEKGVDASDGEWIVAISAKISRSEVYSDMPISADAIDEINAFLNERLTGRPLWYVLGNAQFFDEILRVDERALIPRPETEELVEKALSYIKENNEVLDLCTGSGAIAIAVNKKKNCKVTASDISKDALSLAKENAEICGANITFVESNMFQSLTGRYDCIISNPPYIPSGDISGLQTEVKDFEPRLALDGGADGLEYYKIIALFWKNYLKDDGKLFLECGIGQAEKVASLFIGAKKTEIFKDLEGVERIVVIHK